MVLEIYAIDCSLNVSELAHGTMFSLHHRRHRVWLGGRQGGSRQSEMQFTEERCVTWRTWHTRQSRQVRQMAQACWLWLTRRRWQTRRMDMIDLTYSTSMTNKIQLHVANTSNSVLLWKHMVGTRHIQNIVKQWYPSWKNAYLPRKSVRKARMRF